MQRSRLPSPPVIRGRGRGSPHVALVAQQSVRARPTITPEFVVPPSGGAAHRLKAELRTNSWTRPTLRRSPWLFPRDVHADDALEVLGVQLLVGDCRRVDVAGHVQHLGLALLLVALRR